MYFLKPADPHPITPAKALLLATLCIVWLLTGLVGHDPWKPEEAYSFGVVYSMLQGGNWLVPMLAGEPFLSFFRARRWDSSSPSSASLASSSSRLAASSFSSASPARSSRNPDGA